MPPSTGGLRPRGAALRRTFGANVPFGGRADPVRAVASPGGCSEAGTKKEGGEGMHAVVGVWDVGAGDWEQHQRALREEIMPRIREAPGFVAGYWMADRAAAKTHATIVWADEESARRFEGSVRRPAGQGGRGGRRGYGGLGGARRDPPLRPSGRPGVGYAATSRRLAGSAAG
jgi:hypothetical protein